MRKLEICIGRLHLKIHVGVLQLSDTVDIETRLHQSTETLVLKKNNYKYIKIESLVLVNCKAVLTLDITLS